MSLLESAGGPKRHTPSLVGPAADADSGAEPAVSAGEPDGEFIVIDP
ncbi:hypothetical protein [Brevibacterium atlanticum]|nr:hypothetical protein [Brevibacterium atlanticum]